MTSKKLAILLAVAAAAPSFVFNASAYANESLDEYDLPNYVVEGKADKVYAGGTVVRESSLGVMGDADYMDVPFNVTALSRDAIDMNKGPGNTLVNVLTLDPTVTSSGNNMFNDIKIKGFNVRTTNYYLNGLPGLLGASSVPTDFLDRVEIISGPNTLLNGMSYSASMAGSVNLVPKIAGNDTKITLTESFSGKSHFNHAVDLGARFGEHKEWGIRVNANHEDGKTNFKNEDLKQRNVFVNLDYTTEKTKAQLMYGNSYTDHKSPVAGIRLNGHDIPEIPDGDANFQLPWAQFKYKSEVIALSAEHELDENTGAFIKVGQQKDDWDPCVAVNYPRLQNDKGDVSASCEFVRSHHKNTSFSTGIRTELETGALKHNFVISADRLESEGWIQYDHDFYNGIRPPFTGNIYDNSFVTNNMVRPTPNWMDPEDDGTFEMYGFGVMDRITTEDGKWSMLAGVKRQTVKADTGRQGSTTAWSPNFGLMYSLNDDTKLYANYLQGLGKGKFVSRRYENAGEYLPPQTSEQYEVGVKWDNDKKIGGTFSVFSVEQENPYVDENNYYGYFGRQKNQGAQVTVFGKVAPKWNLMGGVMYLDSTQDGGKNDGQKIPGLSDWNVSLAAEYEMDEEWSVSGRAVLNSSAPVNYNTDRKVPSWWRFDLGTQYKHEMANGDAIRANLTVYNLFDKKYWCARDIVDEALSLEGPRSIAVSISYDF